MLTNIFDVTQVKPDPCPECNAIDSFIITHDGFSVCDKCGYVSPEFAAFVLNSFRGSGNKSGSCGFVDNSFDENDEETVLEFGVSPNKRSTHKSSGSCGQISSGISPKGRYKPIFHWNERIAQMSLTDPPLPSDVSFDIYDKATDGKFGPCEDFTRASVVMLLKSLKLDKYRERWKSILHMCNPDLPMIIPHPNFLEWVEPVYMAVETLFFYYKNLMPKSTIRNKKGTKIKDRHNVIPFNYLFRKIMEHFDCWDFHAELPLLRSATKLHHLDDITKFLFKKIGLKFSRTAVFKRPKIKKKTN